MTLTRIPLPGLAQLKEFFFFCQKPNWRHHGSVLGISNLALPSSPPYHDPESSPSPSSSTSSKPPAKSRPAPTSNEDAAPRKRSRSDMTADERKEARAHRNRIAAQNSRDKRKAQFSALEARIGELEAENRALRAGIAHSHPVAIDNAQQRAVDAAREAETRALRERVRTLETAWEAIIRTLQTQGTMAGLPTLPPPPPPVRTSTPPPSSSSSVLSSPSPSPSHSMTTFPVMVPPNPIFSLDDAIFPISPSPSNASLPSNTSIHLPLSTGGEHPLIGGAPAAGGPMQAVEDIQTPLGTGEDETVDEAAMDELFREILAAPPTPSSTPPSLMCDGGEVPGQDPSLADMNADADTDEVQKEVQRLLDLVSEPGATLGLTMDGIVPLPNEEGDITPLELDLGAWEDINWPPSTSVLKISNPGFQDKFTVFVSLMPLSAHHLTFGIMSRPIYDVSDSFSF
ncbi:hypothetical protein H4582DRAFT_2129342 [Lactarius indigo]|nr:hypothetical protein H4582DRAFT_2129342 [Lactarius indigo]